MKKKLVLLFVACACLLMGCSTPPSAPNTLPPSLMINDVLYFYTGEEVSGEIDEDLIAGAITSTVPLTEMPTENGQSNMEPTLGCAFAQYEGNFIVLMEDKWMLFEARHTDESVSEPDNAASLPPVASDNILISITSNGETTIPYMYWSWSSSWTGDGWLAADALGLIYEQPEIAEELPSVSYHEDFAVQYKEGVTFAYMSIYDEGFERLHHNFPEIDLSLLEELPQGTYYVGISVVVEGEYIESENEHESSGFDCVFKLKVEQ